MTSTDHWVSFEEVAGHQGVARDSDFRWNGRKRLPAYRAGSHWKFRRPEIDPWVHAVGGGDHDKKESPQ